MFNDEIQLENLKDSRPVVWVNDHLSPWLDAADYEGFSSEDVVKAAQSWESMAPLLQAVFPDLTKSGGLVQSKLIRIGKLKESLGLREEELGQLFVKSDADLPVAGSIKARGGIYEVFMFAKSLAQENGFWTKGEGGLSLICEEAKALFSRHTITVGSTGNLGLSVGIAAKALGFQACVHMSTEAKPWKVKRLQDIGVTVVRHETDYTQAVEAAREQSELDECDYFVDDERSDLLFLGYSAAALELKQQLDEQGVGVDDDHPIFFYLPCGIGGAPSGIAFGAKSVWGDNAHCFFVEPVQSPCALVQFASGSDEPVSVYDYGLTNKTEADGMAVARFSHFLAKVMRSLLSGVYTVSDEDLFKWLYLLKETENLKVEPSAASVCGGPQAIVASEQGQFYLARHNLKDKMPNATHILWTTGGSFVPDAQYQEFWQRGKASICSE